MKWIGLIFAIAAGSCLSKILETAQRCAETKGKPRVAWIHAAFWVFWSLTFLLYSGLLGLMVWAGVSMYAEGNTKDAVKLLVVALLLAFCIYRMFIHSLIARRRSD